MRLRLSDPELAGNLRDFLERRDLYLRVWQSLHEWSAVEYVEEP